MDENIVTMTNPNKNHTYAPEVMQRKTSDVKVRHVRLMMDRLGTLHTKRRDDIDGFRISIMT